MSAANFRPPLIAAVAVASGLGAGLLRLPSLESALGRALVETTLIVGATAMIIALLTGRRATVRDITLVCALSALAWTSYGWGVMPMIQGVGERAELSGWSLVLARLVVAATFAAAPFHPDRAPRSAVRSGVTAGTVVAAALAAAVAAGHFWSLPPGRSRLALGVDPLLSSTRVATLTLWAIAAAGLIAAARSTRRPELRAAAVVATVYTMAVGEAVAQPLRAADMITISDATRVGAGLALLACAVRLVRGATAEARASERTELAAMLHDGVCQELALISMMRGAGLPDGDEVVDRAARRALEMARGTIRSLRESSEALLRSGR